MEKSCLTLAAAMACYCSYGQTYLPLSGGILSGSLSINGAPFILTSGGSNIMAAGSSATVFGSGTGTDYVHFVYGNNPFSVWTNSARRFTIDGSGNVGIGTASPAYSLHVSKSTATFALDGITGGFGNSGTVIDLLGWAASNKNWQIGVANIGPAGLNFTPSTTIGGTTFTSPVMTILDNGNVGIGTTNPGMKLHVAYANGSAAISSVSDGVIFQNTNPAPGALNAFYFANSGGFASAAIAVSQTQTGNSGDNLILQTKANAGAWNLSQLVLNTNGNVSIGTADPQGYKLAVNGSAIATSMTVKLNSAWPDYVFKPKYHLPALTELKTYVDLNHHLPDMPSEADVAKDGLNLGEMNKLLIKKVEELTLYLIQLQKEINELKAKVEHLNQKHNPLVK